MAAYVGMVSIGDRQYLTHGDILLRAPLLTQLSILSPLGFDKLFFLAKPGSIRLQRLGMDRLTPFNTRPFLIERAAGSSTRPLELHCSTGKSSIVGFLINDAGELEDSEEENLSKIF